MNSTNNDDIDNVRNPQGAFGVHDDLHDLQEEITHLKHQPASIETNIILVNKINELNARSPTIKILVATTIFTVFVAFLISYNIYLSKPDFVRITLDFISTIFNPALTKYILVGIAAQLVDGALGMAYGVTCSSFLLGLGVPPSLTSASVHVAEIFTTGASGLSHLRFGNVNKKLFKYLLIPGMSGAILGAWLLADLVNGNIIKPFIAIYLMILGVLILRKAFQKIITKQKTKHVGWLAGFGGFMDAVGGGGWGPIVTSTLLSKGRAANYTVGSVNLAEFFIALAGAGTFLIFTGLSGWQAIIGLVIGGVIAAPFAAFLVSRINRKTLMIIVGVLVIILSIRTFVTSDYKEAFETIKGIF